MEECLICGRPLRYERKERQVKCAVCGQAFRSRVQCEGDHYICDACHEKDAVEQIEAYCRHCRDANPIRIAMALMDLPAVHMHGNEHHVLVGAALLTAYCQAGGDVSFADALQEVVRRRHRHGDLHFRCDGSDAPETGRMGPGKSDDGGFAGCDRRYRRPSLLQAKFVYGHSSSRGVLPGAPPHFYGYAGANSMRVS